MEFPPLHSPLAVAGFIVIYKLGTIWQTHRYLDNMDVNMRCKATRTAQNIDEMWYWMIIARSGLCLCDCK